MPNLIKMRLCEMPYYVCQEVIGYFPYEAIRLRRNRRRGNSTIHFVRWFLFRCDKGWVDCGTTMFNYFSRRYGVNNIGSHNVFFCGAWLFSKFQSPRIVCKMSLVCACVATVEHRMRYREFCLHRSIERGAGAKFESQSSIQAWFARRLARPPY